MVVVRMWFLLCICKRVSNRGSPAQQTAGCYAETTEPWAWSASKEGRGSRLSAQGPGALMPPAQWAGTSCPHPPLMQRPKPGEHWGPAQCWPPPHPNARCLVLRLPEGGARAGGGQARPGQQRTLTTGCRLSPALAPHGLSLPQAWSWRLREEVVVLSLAPATVLAQNTCFQPQLS